MKTVKRLFLILVCAMPLWGLVAVAMTMSHVYKRDLLYETTVLNGQNTQKVSVMRTGHLLVWQNYSPRDLFLKDGKVVNQQKIMGRGRGLVITVSDASESDGRLFRMFFPSS